MGKESYKDSPSGATKASGFGLGARGDKPMLTHVPHGLAQVRLVGFGEQDSVEILA